MAGRRFLSDYSKRQVHAQTRIALHLLMLTAVRTSELIEATWDEIDVDKKLWEIPAHRMKLPRAHVVPLSPQAIELFKEAGIRAVEIGTIMADRDPITRENRYPDLSFKIISSVLIFLFTLIVYEAPSTKPVGGYSSFPC